MTNVIGGLTAKKPGSAPCPTLIIEYGTTILYNVYTVFQKKTPTHIVGYKLRNSCLILIIFDNEIPDII